MKTLNFILGCNATFCTIAILTISSEPAHFIVCGVCALAAYLHFSLLIKAATTK